MLNPKERDGASNNFIAQFKLIPKHMQDGQINLVRAIAVS